MNRSLVAVCVTPLLFMSLFAAVSSAQVPTGTPPFGTFGGGPFDVVNLGNLNSYFAITVRQKAGRVTPFVYNITYDTSVWYPVTSGSTQVWQPVSAYGWNFPTPGGSVTNQLIYTQQVPCNPPSNMTMITHNVYAFYVYTDPSGGTHPFNDAFNWYSNDNCPMASGSGSTVTATDGSGYQLTLANWTGYQTITGADGKTYVSPGQSNTLTDANGNQISMDASGNFTDTLGTTALSLTGTFPKYLKYTAPNGSPATWTVNYGTFTIQTNFGCSGISEYTASNAQLITSIVLPDQSSYQFAYEQTQGYGSSYTTARLKSVSLPTGGQIQYQYPLTNNGTKNGINCADGSAPAASGGNPSLTRTLSPGGTWTYARTDVSGNHWQTTVTDPANNQTVIDFQQDSTTGYGATHNFFETQRKAYQGSSSGGTLLATTITCYNTTSPTPANCPTNSVSTLISRTTVFSYLPDTTSNSQFSETDSQFSYVSDPAFPTEVDSYDFGKGAVGPLLRKVLNTYAVVGNSIKLTSNQVQDGGGNIQAGYGYAYDLNTPTATSNTPQHTAIYISRGNLSQIAAQVSSTVTLYKAFTYYDTGMPNTATDWGSTVSGGPNTTTYNYNNSGSPSLSCGNSFVTSISEPMTLAQSYAWDCNGGVLTSTTDENNQVASVFFTGSTFGMSADPYYWRPYATTDFGGNPTTLSYPTNRITESALLFNNNNSVVDYRTKADLFGRPILVEIRQGPSSSNYDTIQTDFDSLGNVAKTYLPFVTSGDAPCSGPCPGVSNGYDALGRLLSMTNAAGGKVSYTYVNNDVSVSVTGGQTFQKQFEYDGLGRLTSVCEISSSLPGTGSCGQSSSANGYLTKYTYNALGQVLNVRQNSQPGGSPQQRTFVYDMLGRLTSESNPETGTTTYIYDFDSTCGSSPGDLVKKVDAALNVTCRAYDPLHRTVQITYPSGPNASATPAKYYAYDTQYYGNGGSNLKGRLVAALTCQTNYSCAGNSVLHTFFGYSRRGEVTDVWEDAPHSNGMYHVGASYWAHGAINNLAMGNFTPTLVYGWPAPYGSGLDGEGRYTRVSATSGADPVQYQGVTYTTSGTSQPIGSLTQVTYGSGDFDTFSYDPKTGLMKGYGFNVGTNGQADIGALTWNSNGTLQQLAITDTLTPSDAQTCTYSHDDLSRVASVNCANGSTQLWNQNFAYDALGNITKSVPSGGTGITFSPTYNGANQFATLPSGTPTYDMNGNLTGDGTNSFSYDADGNTISINGVTVTYDALDRAIEKNFGGGTYVQAVYGPAGNKIGLMIGQNLAEARFPLPGGGQVIYGPSGITRYWHPDWLGTSRLTTTPTRAVGADAGFAPFGEPYGQSGQFDFAFTGSAYVDTAWGIYDYMYREYNPTQGRWISPDPAGLAAVDPTNPQSWNRYAYVMNNPLAFVDPLGLDGCPGASSDVPCITISAKPCPGGSTYQNGNCYVGPCLNGVGTITVQGVLICGTSAMLQSIYNGLSQWLQYVGSSQSSSGGGTNGSGPTNNGTCNASTGNTSIVTGTATSNSPTIVAGAAIGGFIGSEPGAFLGGILGSLFGVGGTASYVPSTKSLYAGPALVFAPALGGGSGVGITVSSVPPSQNPNSIANGWDFSVGFQPLPFLGSTVVKSPGSGPPVVGPSAGTRVPVSFGVSYSVPVKKGGC